MTKEIVGQNQQRNPPSSECSVFELAAQFLDSPDLSTPGSVNHVPIINAVHQLLVGLGTGETNKVEEALSRLGAPQESDLFLTIGQMTRALHNSLREFKESLNRDNLTLTTTNIPDAADKLEAVLKMTFEAAQTTLAGTEEQEVVLGLASKNMDEIERIVFELDLPQAKQLELRKRFSDNREHVATLNAATSRILMAQSFQDLAGQALKKVIILVTEIERGLVDLIKIFGGQSKLLEDSQVVPRATSVENKVPSANQVGPANLQQDDVDSILSSFGF